jgi:hypothetical protein
MDQRMSVIEAARVLNLSEAAVRARIRRGSLESVRDEDGNVFVMVDPDVVGDAPHDESEDSTRASRELIDTLQEQLRLEREARACLMKQLARDSGSQRCPFFASSRARMALFGRLSAFRAIRQTRPRASVIVVGPVLVRIRSAGRSPKRLER